jgi:hypothetical protein
MLREMCEVNAHFGILYSEQLRDIEVTQCFSTIKCIIYGLDR